MNEGDFELDGVTWGNAPATLICSDFEQAGVEIRVQDVEVPGGHGVLPGRDLMSKDTWTWLIYTNREDAPAALADARAMSQVWRSYLDQPDRLASLRVMVGGEVRRVFGRPRRWLGPNGGVLTRAGSGRIDATFDLTDPLIYDDVEQSLELSLVTSASTGVILPVTLPATFGSASATRQGQVNVEGKAAIPFSITFHGPVTGNASGFWAQGPGWRVDLNTSIAFDQSVTVDTRTHTVTRSDGLSLAGAARGRFLAARLSPGLQEVSWGATDPTNTARAVIAWRPGYFSL